VSFGTELLFIFMLALLLLGPKQLHSMLGYVARAKVELEKATRGMKSQLAAELDAGPRVGETDARINHLGTREPSSDGWYWTANPAVRRTREQSFQAAGLPGRADSEDLPEQRY
jgi:Sec-independent protein translocase protein TatA